MAGAQTVEGWIPRILNVIYCLTLQIMSDRYASAPQQEPCLLTVEIGGTVTRGVLMSHAGRAIARLESPTRPAHKPILQSVLDLKLRLESQAQATSGAVAVALACALDPRSWRVSDGAKLGLEKGVDLAASLRAVASVPALVRTELAMAALGEARHGVGRDYTDFVVLTIGTGFGVGLVLNGRPYIGTRGVAGEIGHIPVTWSGEARPCNCGRTGCLESYAAGGSLTKSTSIGLFGSPQGVSHLLESGDPIATTAVGETARYIAWGICICINAYNPEAVVLRGGFVRALWPYISADVSKFLQATALAPDTPILFSALKDDGVFLGLLETWLEVQGFSGEASA